MPATIKETSRASTAAPTRSRASPSGPNSRDARGAAPLEHRFQWTAPIVTSPFDPNTIYYGGERIFKTSDGGTHWEAISGDLTRNDKSKQQPSGGPVTVDDTGTEYYDTVFSIAPSPLAKGLIWAGTDDGLDPTHAR